MQSTIRNPFIAILLVTGAVAISFIAAETIVHLLLPHSRHPTLIFIVYCVFAIALAKWLVLPALAQEIPKRILVLGLPRDKTFILRITCRQAESLTEALQLIFCPQAIYVNETFTLTHDREEIVALFAQVTNAPVIFFDPDINLPPGII